MELNYLVRELISEARLVKGSRDHRKHVSARAVVVVAST